MSVVKGLLEVGAKRMSFQKTIRGRPMIYMHTHTLRTVFALILCLLPFCVHSQSATMEACILCLAIRTPSTMANKLLLRASPRFPPWQPHALI